MLFPSVILQGSQIPVSLSLAQAQQSTLTSNLVYGSFDTITVHSYLLNQKMSFYEVSIAYRSP